MADIENGINDSLVATAEPDEEANRRCCQRILGVFNLVMSAMNSVLSLMCLYYGLKADSSIPWAICLVFALGMLQFMVLFPIISRRQLFWKILCEICNPEKEYMF
jgi:hypothetical protein